MSLRPRPLINAGSIYNRNCAIDWAAGSGSGSCGCGCGCSCWNWNWNWNGDGLPRNRAIRSWTVSTRPSGFWRGWTSYRGEDDASTEAYIRGCRGGRAGSYRVEFDMPAYLGLYPSFLVVFPYQAWRPVAFHKQLAATTNNTGNFTSSFGYLIMGFWPMYQSAP